ncbi:DUF488 family protein, N3 subclade [Natronomonas sp.]|uniref:DUF488 family protein, N3 subclade n=1 Tax=Natronomonas sp. TaxID=2184060 RepID=UPI002FC34DF8
MAGTVSETYVAAIQHDLVDLGGATAVGVVRRPSGWFHGSVDENHPELGPPEDLLDETKRRQEDLAMAGMCETGAHNAAWEETNFAERYREYINTDANAAAALDALRERLRDGEDLVLVCFEADDKRCHRDVLVDLLE